MAYRASLSGQAPTLDGGDHDGALARVLDRLEPRVLALRRRLLQRMLFSIRFMFFNRFIIIFNAIDVNGIVSNATLVTRAQPTKELL